MTAFAAACGPHTGCPEESWPYAARPPGRCESERGLRFLDCLRRPSRFQRHTLWNLTGAPPLGHAFVEQHSLAAWVIERYPRRRTTRRPVPPGPTARIVDRPARNPLDALPEGRTRVLRRGDVGRTGSGEQIATHGVEREARIRRLAEHPAQCNVGGSRIFSTAAHVRVATREPHLG